MTSVLYSFNRAQLLRFIAGELLAIAVVLVLIYNISWDNILEKNVDTSADVMAASIEVLGDCASEAVFASESALKEECEETMWVINDGTEYRTGPNDRYLAVGSLGESEDVDLLGVTYNNWSLVDIDGKEYYISSDDLTSDPPLITATGQKGEYQKYALSLMDDYGWEATEITPLINLWNRESGWNPSAHNKSSGAHGIPQALPGSKMASEGSDWSTNGETQIRWGLNYISGRYGSPSGAWSHFCSHHWY